MLSKGATVGAVSGKNRVWNQDQIVRAPKGEFGHLPESHYRIVSDTETAKAQPQAERAVGKPKRSASRSRKKSKDED